MLSALSRHCFKYGRRKLRLGLFQFSSVGEEVDFTDQSRDSVKPGGFAKAFERQAALDSTPSEPDFSFAHLFRNSKFVDLGDPRGKVVTGTIFHVVNDDLYIDFGWKFHCVCTRPNKYGSDYVRGAKVKLKIKHLELSTKFLGYNKDLTLLEADCTLLGLTSTPFRKM